MVIICAVILIIAGVLAIYYGGWFIAAGVAAIIAGIKMKRGY